ncbi:AGC/DMPK/GEK protein kinase [Rhodotorula diobovata]|uniref:AGC/DMPK/GEK protein kinase n=1 Tax=Rhodotorula diobovata TaxID=5288 RepID=A0A5C5G4H8_9BASI|nr:AGC/DMPK/GEK protein kinase [Rhodotorula diobovata]
MSGWTQRALDVNKALAELPAGGEDDAHSSDLRLHLALLRADAAPRSHTGQPPPLKRLRTASLALDDFAPLSTLSSSGSFTRVELVRPASSLIGLGSEANGDVLVMKTIDKRWAFRMRAHQHVRHELAVLRLSRSDSAAGRIPSLVASFLSPTSFHLVLAHSPGGDLCSVLERHNEGVEAGQATGLPEEWVKGWKGELVDAVAWLHGEGWAHRDIKPQNLLLDAAGHLQLTDFGSSAPLTPGTTSIARKHCRVLLGTPDYIAPEVLKHAEKVYQEEEEDEEEQDRSAFGASSMSKKEEVDQEERAYGAEVDWWACGIVLYELLFGCTPFFAEEISETYERIVHWQDHLQFAQHVPVSEAARAVISRLLVAADARPSASSIRALSWFSSVKWDQLREAAPAYVPPPFVPPSCASSDSFARSHTSSAAQSFDFTSFFSSPGLSILRPSPRGTSAAQTEESEYWTATGWGGLTTLPPPDAFAVSPSAAGSAPSEASNSAAAVAARPAAPPPSTAFSTPLRPLSRLAHLAAAYPSTGRSTGAATPHSRDSGSARSRRVMQEHAWSVGRSAKKVAREKGTAADVSRGAAVALAKSAPATPAVTAEVETRADGTPGRQIQGLQRRQEEVVEQIDRLEEKYRTLFELAAREVTTGGTGSERV